MGNNEEGKPSKCDKSSSPTQSDQTNIHVYPDWAAMQAYYGSRMTMPPYYNSAVASGHAPPPYMWGPPQPMMPPYGTPYATIYSHGGVYAHPAVPLGSHGHGVPASPVASIPVGVETPTKSSGNTDRGLMKKLKGFDGLAMSIGNGTAENTEGDAEHRLSQSGETEGSSEGSDGNTTGTDQTRRKRSREGTPTIGGDAKMEAKSNAGEGTAASDKVLNATVCPAKSMNERELKRERRKQSNRESARRSRLRKQAETEELARKVESLTADNVALKSEINQMAEKSEKLRIENATLAEKLKSAQLEPTQEIILDNIDDKRAPVSTENLLSRVSNSGSVDRNVDEEEDAYEKNSNSGTKLHQLLDTSPRADAVAAG